VVIKDGKISAKDGRGGGMGQGTYRLDAGTKQLDAVGLAGQQQGKNFTGIYRLNGDNLEWCVANPGIPRPTQYYTRQQVQFHLILTRKK
jgi:uncharacterized protein (TIGR03067 family)